MQQVIAANYQFLITLKKKHGYNKVIDMRKIKNNFAHLYDRINDLTNFHNSCTYCIYKRDRARREKTNP